MEIQTPYGFYFVDVGDGDQHQTGYGVYVLSTALPSGEYYPTTETITLAGGLPSVGGPTDLYPTSESLELSCGTPGLYNPQGGSAVRRGEFLSPLGRYGNTQFWMLDAPSTSFVEDTTLDTFCASHTHIGFTFHLWSMNIFIIFVIVLYADSAPGMIVPSANFNACNDVLILSIIGKVSTITHMASVCHICCSISDRISALVSHIAPLTHVCVTVSIVGSPFSLNISGIASLFSNNVTTHSNASDLNFSLWVAVFIPLIVFAIP